MAKRKAKKKGPSITEVRQAITDQMVAAIQNGTPPWRKSWASSVNLGFPTSVSSSKCYQGINALLLMLMPYESKFWGTGHAWSERASGVHIKAGERATRVIFWNFIQKKDPETNKPILNDEGKPVTFPMMRLFPVFNAEQITGPKMSLLMSWEVNGLHKFAKEHKIDVPKTGKQKIAQIIHDTVQERLEKYLCVEVPAQNQEPDYIPAEELMKATKADIRHGGDRAFYRPSEDFVQLPNKDQFKNMAHYYETAMHELSHWTENDNRVGKVDKHTYAWGELVAEISACFMCAALGVPQDKEMLEHSASYLQSWLKGMNGDTKFVFDAATQASKASDYLLDFIAIQEDREKEAA